MAGAAPLAGCGADREEDEEHNLAILHQLQAFPGALELEVSTDAYHGDEEGPFDRAEGHTTSITYRAPGRNDAEGADPLLHVAAQGRLGM